jgi:pimeloyl-ACP methyl ester carboxylesterase
VSGSGKSSLVGDVLEPELRRRLAGATAADDDEESGATGPGGTFTAIEGTEQLDLPLAVATDARHLAFARGTELTVALVQGERSFPSFEAMVDATVAASPHRSRESLQRGVFHNAKQLDDGTWTWRYDTFRWVPSDERSESGNRAHGFAGLWDDASALHTPTTLVRGAKSFFVNDDDAAEFARSAPGFQQVVVVPDAGHSVQGDQPRALVEILRSVLD